MRNLARTKTGKPNREVGSRPERLPLWLLLLVLSTVFLCSADKGYFYRPIPADWDTVKNLAIAENLSPDHNFRLFRGRRQGSGGARAYDMYSRFPVGGYALIKLAILPFGNDMSARILAARMLVLLLFAAAALLAFHSLARLTSHRWVALAATLTAFSSSYMLYYGNVVSNEFSMELFAVMLVFHGMVVFVQEGRFRQLLARTCVALLLGWRVYAFLLPFIVLGAACEAVRAWKGGAAPWPRLRSAAGAVLRSRYLALGVFALLFGTVVLGFNFANEYAAFGGETRVAELPSVRSMLWRTGLDQGPSFDPGWWLRFLQQQFFRVGVASVPFVLAERVFDLPQGLYFGEGGTVAFNVESPEVDLLQDLSSGWMLSVSLLMLLMAVVASTTMVCLARRLLAPGRRLPMAALALSGFFWALPMRHNVEDAAHEHEALFYVGVPLVCYSLLLLYVHKRWGPRPVAGLAVALLLAFVVSTFRMEQRLRMPARVVEVRQAIMAETGTIRETTRGKAIMILPSVKPEWFLQNIHSHYALRDFLWQYYLAGIVLPHFSDMYGLRHLPDMEAAARAADFILTRDRVESDALLTPGNEQVFLYDSAGIDDLVEFYRATHQRVVSGEPAARCHFDVYLGDGALFHVRDTCVRKDVRRPFFVEVFPEDPEDPEDLPGSARWYLEFDYNSVRFDGKCMAVLPLPDYPISRIRTGQKGYGHQPFCRGRSGKWEVEIPASR